MTQPKIKYYNIGTHEAWAPKEVSVKKRYIPSPEKLRERAMEDYEEHHNSPSAKCCECGDNFLLDYMRFVKISSWNKTWICSYCQRTKHYPVYDR
jgi:hypothetical protein